MQTRKRKRDTDFPLHDESTVAPSESLRPQEDSPASPTVSAEEDSVEAMLGTCSISPGHVAADNETQDILAFDDAISECGSELQYPPSDPMVVDSESENAVTLPDPPMRSASEPATLTSSDDTEVRMDVDSGSATDSALDKPIPCSRFYGSAAGKGKGIGKELVVSMSPEIPYHDPATEVKDVEVHDIDNDNESEETSVPEPTEFCLDKSVSWVIFKHSGLIFGIRTYIFTFDSLGTKHPAAIRNLSTYLQMEAKDKKGLDFTQTTPATPATALVSNAILRSYKMVC